MDDNGSQVDQVSYDFGDAVIDLERQAVRSHYDIHLEEDDCTRSQAGIHDKRTQGVLHILSVIYFRFGQFRRGLMGNAQASPLVRGGQNDPQCFGPVLAQVQMIRGRCVMAWKYGHTRQTSSEEFG